MVDNPFATPPAPWLKPNVAEAPKESPKEEVKEEVKRDNMTVEEEKTYLLEKIQSVLGEHDNMESNIGVGHDYWKWCSRYRELLSK